MRRMRPRTGPGVKPPDAGDVLVEGHPVDAELVELLGEQLGRHAVEEEVDGEDHDHEVVEAAEDRDVVRDEVAAEDEVAGGAPRAAPCAPAGVRSSRTRATDEPGVDRGAAGERQERHDPERPTDAGPARAGAVCGRSSSDRRTRLPSPWIDLVTAGRTAPPRARAAESTIRARANPASPSAANLDIERPFGMMHPKGGRG